MFFLEAISQLVDYNAWSLCKRFFTFQDPLAVNILIISVFMGISSGILGTLLSLRKRGLFSDVVAHAVLPGIAISFIFTADKGSVFSIIGAFISSVCALLLIKKLVKTNVLSIDLAMGFTLGGAYCVGTFFIGIARNSSGGADMAGINTLFFGQIAAISPTDLIYNGILAVISILFFCFWKNRFITICFDYNFTYLSCINQRVILLIFWSLIILSVTFAVNQIGALLVVALFVIPPASAFFVTYRVLPMTFLSILYCVISIFIGSLFSFIHTNIPSGPAIILCLVFLLCSNLIVYKIRNLK